MSYDRITPAYYKTYQQDTPYHAGARGWTQAPWPTWGNNPQLAGRRLLATDGLGAITAVSGLGSPDGIGAYAPNVSPIGGGTSTVAHYEPISGGLGAYFKNQFTQPISPAGRGAITTARYEPISGLGCTPCQAAAKAAQQGVGAGDPATWSPIAKGLVLAGIGLGVWWAMAPMFRKHARNGRGGRRMRRNGRWSRKYKDTLPDSAFLYVAPGGMAHIEGGKKVTHPLSLRHFPVRNASGAVDVSHVRNALARIGRSSVPASVKPKLQAKARALLGTRSGARKAA